MCGFSREAKGTFTDFCQVHAEHRNGSGRGVSFILPFAGTRRNPPLQSRCWKIFAEWFGFMQHCVNDFLTWPNHSIATPTTKFNALQFASRCCAQAMSCSANALLFMAHSCNVIRHTSNRPPQISLPFNLGVLTLRGDQRETHSDPQHGCGSSFWLPSETHKNGYQL